MLPNLFGVMSLHLMGPTLPYDMYDMYGTSLLCVSPSCPKTAYCAEAS